MFSRGGQHWGTCDAPGVTWFSGAFASSHMDSRTRVKWHCWQPEKKRTEPYRAARMVSFSFCSWNQFFFFLLFILLSRAVWSKLWSGSFRVEFQLSKCMQEVFLRSEFLISQSTKVVKALFEEGCCCCCSKSKQMSSGQKGDSKSESGERKWKLKLHW